MKIAVYGTGGVGGYFGGRLAQAGHSVAFIARGAQLEAIQQHGLIVESVAGNFTVQPAWVEGSPAAVGEVDVVILGVKAWQVPAAAQAIAPLIGLRTLVVPLQNGVDAPGQLAHALDASGSEPHVIGGLCRIVSMIAGPGQIRHAGLEPYIAFNRLDGQPDERVEALRAAFASTKGVKVEVPADIFTALWAKFVFIAAFGGVGAVTRAPAGAMRNLAPTRQMLVEAIDECAAVGRAHGAALPEQITAQTMATIDGLPAGGSASMQRDIMEGKPSELEAQTGAVVRLGEKKGIATPLHRFIYASLLPQEDRARS